MDREYIETHNVIERYHLGKLSEEEAAAFEDLFVFDKELRDEVDLAEKLIQGIQGQKESEQNARASELVNPPTPDAGRHDLQPHTPTGELTHAKNPRAYGLHLAIAATVLLGITSTFLFIQNRDLVQQRHASVSQVNPLSLHLETYRSTSQAVPVLEAGEGIVTFLIDSSGTGTGPHRLLLMKSDGAVVIETETFETDPTDPWIEWLVDRQVLRPASYRIELFSETEPASTQVADFVFEIRPSNRLTPNAATE